MKILAIIIIVLGFLLWLGQRSMKKLTPEERLMLHYQKQIQRYKPENLPADASVVEHFIKALKDFAVKFNQCEVFAQIAVKLWRISEEGGRPLIVLVMGEFKTGKSTFINTLLGRAVLTADVAPATAVTTVLKYGEHPEVKLYFLDGSRKVWPYNKLREITAEGDESKRSLRDSLDYVELTYPCELLKRINLVDTPGLNVHNDSHIRNTENFQHKADVVLWVFNATRSVTQTELREIKALGERLKPFAIVNRIDNIDDEEESVEDVLSNIRKRLGNSVQGIFGLSALQAQKAIQTRNEYDLQECGWAVFVEQLEAHFLSCSEELKIKSLTEKVRDIVLCLQTDIVNMKRIAVARDQSFSDQDTAEKRLRDDISALDEIHDTMLGIDSNIQSVGKAFNQLEGQREDTSPLENTELLMTTANDLLNIIRPLLNVKCFFNEILSNVDDERKSKLTAFMEDINMMDEEMDYQVECFNQWIQEEQVLNDEAENLNSEWEQLMILQKDYENSGLFGGKPIFDFSGRKQRLNSAGYRYNQNRRNLTQHIKEYWWKYLSIGKDTYAKDVEIGKLAKQIDEFLLNEKAELLAQLKHVQQNFELEQKKQLELKNNIKIGEDLLIELQQEILA